jgi:hypothetical protein
MMTGEEAREELMRRFPGKTVSVTINYWHFSHDKTSPVRWHIAYNFNNNAEPSILYGDSFEEILEELDKKNEEINKVISLYSILLRKFD